jgi:uncharacterized protein
VNVAIHWQAGFTCQHEVVRPVQSYEQLRDLDKLVGYIDAMMVQYSPWLDKQPALSKALDACHERGIGLISMKQIAGRLRGGETLKGILDAVQRRVSTFEERRLTPFQGLLHAIWSDERISAACVAMQNTDQVRENADAVIAQGLT